MNTINLSPLEILIEFFYQLGRKLNALLYERFLLAKMENDCQEYENILERLNKEK